jgi:hypothetical protein
MRPTAKECHRARDLGGQARRAGHKVDTNPYRNGLNERDRVLAEYWQDGWEQGKRR